MNKLPLLKKIQIINLLVEGCSISTTSRISDVSTNTVRKLLVDVGSACQQFHNDNVINIKSKRVQVEELCSLNILTEINSPIKKKEDVSRNVWTWIGLDVDSKLVVSCLISDRKADSANLLLNDISQRVTKNIQLTTDGYKAYLLADERVCEKDFNSGIFLKLFGENKNVNEPEKSHSRIKNKIANYFYAIALHLVYYNFVKIHKNLGVTPAMQVGLTKMVMTLEDVVLFAEANEKRLRRD